MKKQLFLLLMAVFLVMMLPLISYAENTTVVFLDGTVETSGDGSAPGTAVKTMDEAFDLLSNGGGTIVVSGNTTITETYTFPAQAEKVTITGRYDGVAYNSTLTVAGSSKVYLLCTSEIEFAYLTINRTSSGGCVEFFSGPSLTFGDGMIFQYNGGVLGTNTIAVRLGYFDKECPSAAFTMTSGTLSYVAGGNNKYTVGTSTINFGGTAQLLHMLQCGGTSQDVGASIVNITGGTIPEVYINGHGAASIGAVTLTIQSANVSILKDHRTTGNTEDQISGPVNVTVDNTNVGTIELGSITLNGVANLTLKNQTDYILSDNLAGWTGLNLINSTVIMSGEYEGPSTITADINSMLVLDQSTQTLPAVSGEGTVCYSNSLSVVFLNGSVESSGTGINDGAPVKTLTEAYGKLANTGGTIVLCGDVTVSETFSFPTKEGKVTITGRYDNVNYNPTWTIAGSSKVYYHFSSETEFSYLTFNRTSSGGCVEFFTGPALIFGDGLEMLCNNAPIEESMIAVRSGNYSSNCSSAAFTMRSGSLSYIQGGNNKYAVGTSVITLSNTANIVDFVQGGGTGKDVSNVVLNISDISLRKLYLNGYGDASAGQITCNIQNADIEAIVDHRTTGNSDDSIAGPLVLTIKNSNVDAITMGNIGLGGNASLTFESCSDVVIDSGLSGWNALTLINSTVHIKRQYNGPDTINADENSTLEFSNRVNTTNDLPNVSGDGVAILAQPRITYTGDTYDESTILTFTPNVSVQGTAIYGDYAFIFYPPGKCFVFDLSSSTPSEKIGTFDLASYNNADPDSKWTNHCNQAMFGPEKWDESDPFPLLYVTTGNAGDCVEDGYIARCAVERILYDENTQTWSAQLVQTIVYNDYEYEAPYNADTGRFIYESTETFANLNGYERIGFGWPASFVDSDPTTETMGKFYLFSARFRTTEAWETTNIETYGITNYYEDNAYIITSFVMPDLPTTESEFGRTVTLTPQDITDQFTTPFDIYATQGGTMYQGRIYYSFGFGDTTEKRKDGIRVFDVAQKEIIAKIDLSNSEFANEEPECCCIYNGQLALSANSQKIWLFEYIESLWQYGESATCITSGACWTFDCLTGQTLQSGTSTNAGNHAATEVRGYVAPTETTKGYSGDVYCSDCGMLISAGEEIPELE